MDTWRVGPRASEVVTRELEGHAAQARLGLGLGLGLLARSRLGLGVGSGRLEQVRGGEQQPQSQRQLAAAPLRVQPERGEQPRGVTGRGPLPEAEQEGVGGERRRAERERERLHSEGEQEARSAAHHPGPLVRVGDRAQAPWFGLGIGLGFGLG